MGSIKRFAVRFIGAYVVFGVGYVALANAYCNHRAAVGKPSDLPCNNLLWDSIAFSAWPLPAVASLFMWDKAIVPYPILLRVLNVVVVAGYAAALVWAFHSLLPGTDKGDAPSPWSVR